MKTIFLILMAAVLVTLGGCARDTSEPPAEQDDRVVPLVSTEEDFDNLILWYDSKSNEINVFDREALEALVEEDALENFEWTPGAATATIMLQAAGGGVLRQQAPVRFPPIEDMDPRAVWASVGDIRTLRYRRQLNSFAGADFPCSNDLRFTPLARPANTQSAKVSNRAFTWLQFVGTMVGTEMVRYTARRYYYSGRDCGGTLTTADSVARWTITVGVFAPG